MTENKEPGRRDINTGGGNYNERIGRDYIHNVYIINIPQKENEVQTKQTNHSSKDGKEKTKLKESQNISSPTIQQRELQQLQDQIKERIANLKLPNDNFDSYNQLREFLKKKEWKQADRETIQVILNLFDKNNKRKKYGFLRDEDIISIDCIDLLKIDLLWLEASDNWFGFSVQGHIWLRKLGIELKPNQLKNSKNIRDFGNFVGWYKNDELLKTRDDYNFSLNAPQGHLPSLRFPCSEFPEMNWFQSWKRIFKNFLIRTENCRNCKLYK